MTEENPTQGALFAKKFDVYRESVSRALIELEKADLVKCITPQSDRYRAYQITPIGKKIRKQIESFKK